MLRQNVGPNRFDNNHAESLVIVNILSMNYLHVMDLFIFDIRLRTSNIECAKTLTSLKYQPRWRVTFPEEP